MEKRFSTDPITVIPPAWKADYSFDRDSFVNAIDLIKSYDKFALYFGCTASEGHSFSREMLLDTAKLFAEQMKGYAHHYFVGLIGLSLAEMIERVDALKAIGIKGFMFALPSWGVLRSPVESYDFVNRLCAAHRDCNFIFVQHRAQHNAPLPPDLKVLEEKNPNLVAVKQGGHAYVDARYSAALETPLSMVEYYLDYAWTYANLYFDPSFMPSTISCSYRRTIDFYEAGLRKDIALCTEIDKEIQKADQLMAELFPMDRIDGAYDKMWLKMSIPDYPLRLYPPYECFSDELFEEYRDRMKQLLPNWF